MPDPYCPKNRYGYSTINVAPFDCYPLTGDPETPDAPSILLTEYNKTESGAAGIKLEFTPMVFKDASPKSNSTE